MDELETQGVSDVQEAHDIDPSQDNLSLEGQESVEESVYNWEQDKRHVDMWKGDPNNLYKSYINMEKQFPKTQAELNTYKERLSKFQEENKAYESQVGELSQFKQLYDFINTNPLYNKAVGQAILEAQREEKRMKYGDLPPEAIAKLEEGVLVKQQFEELKQEKAREAAGAYIDKSLSEIDALATQYGVEYDQREFLLYCKKNNINSAYLKDVFLAKAFPTILDITNKKAQSNVTRQVTTNKQMALSAVPSRGKPNSQPTANDKLLAALRK